MVREDFEASDIPMIYLMLGTVVDFSREADPGAVPPLPGDPAGGHPGRRAAAGAARAGAGPARFQAAMAGFKTR